MKSRRGELVVALLLAGELGAGLGCGSGSAAKTTPDAGGKRDATAAVDAKVDAGAADRPQPRWTQQASGVTDILFGIWGSGPNDVYVAAANYNLPESGAVLHSTGDGTWVAQTTGITEPLLSIWGSGPGDIYAGGNTMFHSTGNGAWTAQTTGIVQAIYGIWGSGPADVYLVGGNDLVGTVLHSTGDGSWTLQATVNANLSMIWGSGPKDLYATGVGEVGTTFTGYISRSAGNGAWSGQVLNPDPGTRNLWGSSANDVYIVGSPGSVLHSTGDGTWTAQSTAQPNPGSSAVYAIWGSGPDDIYVGGDGSTIVHYTGNGVWTTEAGPSLVGGFVIMAIWGSGPGDVYAVGQDGVILHRRPN